ncbi:MAG: hypothetical protein EOO38_01475 [Cytophagaceae bacterium]|nr:MAG: hypothetical protein EOO38_01475 [Cytophagaceae bacterium]
MSPITPPHTPQDKGKRPVSDDMGPFTPPQKLRRARPLRQYSHAEDVYVRAMFEHQAKQFLTEGDNQVHAPRLPEPYYRALVPLPKGQAREDVAYFNLHTDEPERPDPAIRLDSLSLEGPAPSV